MPKTSLTTGRCGGANRVSGERWRPLAHHLAMRFVAAGGHDAELTGIAFGVFVDAEQRLDCRRPDFLAIVVPQVVRAHDGTGTTGSGAGRSPSRGSRHSSRRWWPPSASCPGACGGPRRSRRSRLT